MSVETLEPFTYKGHWWLPESPEERVCGTLTYVPQDGAALELFGSFSSSVTGLTRLFAPKIILGESDHGRVTLHDCVQTHLTLGSMQSCSFEVRNILLGYHFSTEHDIAFKRLLVHYSSLDEWINRSGFDKKVLAESMHPPWDRFTIVYERPQLIEAALSADCNISLYFQVSFPGLSYLQKEACIVQEDYVELEFSSNRGLNDCYDELFHLRNFLTLGISAPICTLKLRGYIQDREDPIKIFSKQQYMPQELELIHPLKVLFSFDFIAERFALFLKNWYSKRGSLKRVYELYFSLVYNPHMYLDDRFSSLCEAAEAYHKAIVNPKRISLRIRLSDIVDEFWRVATTFIPDKKAFTDTVVDTRNYLSHPDVKPKKNVVSGNELFFVTQQLRLLVEICLLKETGFTVDEIDGLFAKSDKHQQLVALIRSQTTRKT
jgi:hypothetical protein